MDVLIDEPGRYELNPPPALVTKIGLDICLASFHRESAPFTKKPSAGRWPSE